MYMLDTNILVYAIRHPKDGVHEIIKRHIFADLCISAITLGELEYGVQKSANPQRNRLALMEVLSGIEILDFDSAAAVHFGDIFGPWEWTGIAHRDRTVCLIAATQGRPECYTLVH